MRYFKPGSQGARRSCCCSSMMRLVMEHLDFAKALEHGGSISGKRSRSCGHGALSEQEARRSGSIRSGIFAAPTGRACHDLLREGTGVYLFAKDVSGTQAIVEGIIDCFFEEDGMVIIDYKNSYGI